MPASFPAYLWGIEIYSLFKDWNSELDSQPTYEVLKSYCILCGPWYSQRIPSLPMRYWNYWIEIVKNENTLFPAYLWGIEIFWSCWAYRNKNNSQPTYEVLKFAEVYDYLTGYDEDSQPTYEVLKCLWLKNLSKLKPTIPSLPMRYWNLDIIIDKNLINEIPSLPMRYWNSNHRIWWCHKITNSQPTYEVLKSSSFCLVEIENWIPSLPMRYWNLFFIF